MSDADDIRQAAADYVRSLGSGAVEWLQEQAELADSIGDHEAAGTWREIADAAKAMTGSR
jgi:hypothetical protein